MKKVLISLIVASSQSFAAMEKTEVKPLPFGGKPAVALQVFEVKNNVFKPIQGTKLSIRKKQNQLCWQSVNVPLQSNNMVAEAFYAPNEFKLNSPNSQITSSNDKKNHTIVTEIKTSEVSQYIRRCWSFDRKDPTGKYQMEVQINDHIFKGLEFEIVK